MQYILLALAFMSIFLLVIGVYNSIYGTRIATLKRMQITAAMMDSQDDYEQKPTITERGKGLVGVIGRIAPKSSYLDKTRSKLLKSYIKMKPEEFVAVSLIVALVIGMILYIPTRNLVLLLLGLLIGFKLPDIYVNSVKKKRGRKLNSQLPQALTIISNGLRAGFSFTQAMGVASREMDTPISDEFARVLRDNSLGKPLEEALENLSKRTDDEDLDMFITALLIQRQVGGNLAEVLDTISETIRERVRLRGEVRTLTSQGRIEALVIGVLPFGISVIVALLNPSYLEPLVTTTIGLFLLIGALILMGIGIYILTKMVDVKV
jgi:tight adherence protein B